MIPENVALLDWVGEAEGESSPKLGIDLDVRRLDEVLELERPPEEVALERSLEGGGGMSAPG